MTNIFNMPVVLRLYVMTYLSTLSVEVIERKDLNKDFQLLLRVAITQSTGRLPFAPQRVADELEK